MEKELQVFTQKAIDKYKKSISDIDGITDTIFLIIQNDRELFHEWLDLMEKKKRNTINSTIAKAIKKEFELENKENGGKKKRNNEPKSFLIKSFQEFVK